MMQNYTKTTNYNGVIYFFFLGETMAALAQFDDAYNRVCRMFDEQRTINSTVVGDSHGVRLYNNLQRSFQADFRLTRSYARGGAMARRINVQGMRRDDGTHVVIVWIQGNDLDEIHDMNVQLNLSEYIRRQAARGVFRIFLELTRLNKIVYVVLLPTRYSVRHASLDRYQHYCRRFNNVLRKFLESRVISLNPDCYTMNAYSDQVHLTDDWYDATAVRVHEHIKRDLQGSRTLPSRFMRRFLRWMRNNGWE